MAVAHETYLDVEGLSPFKWLSTFIHFLEARKPDAADDMWKRHELLCRRQLLPG